MPTSERSILYVEGKDDLHTVKHLLRWHKITVFIRGSQSNTVDPNVPELKEAGGKEKLIRMIKTTVSVSSSRSVGFVLDGDDRPQDRWSAERGRLQKCELDPQKTCQPMDMLPMWTSTRCVSACG